MVGWRRKGIRQGTDFPWERFPNSRFFACDFWVSKSSSYAVYVWKRLCFVSCDTRTRTRLAHAHTRALAHSHVHTQIYVHIYLYMRVCVVISLTDGGSRCTLECLQRTTISAQRQERILFRNVSRGSKSRPLRAPASPARTSDIIILQLVSFAVSVGFRPATLCKG